MAHRHPSATAPWIVIAVPDPELIPSLWLSLPPIPRKPPSVAATASPNTAITGRNPRAQGQNSKSSVLDANEVEDEDEDEVSF